MILQLIYSNDHSDAGFPLSGPKGVINDWRKYKQLKVEQKQEQKKEMERLIKKLSMTCRSDLDLEKDKEKEKQLQEKIKGKVSWKRCIKQSDKLKTCSVCMQTVMRSLGLSSP